ncbi:hypothetical protein Plhal304r1_c004g0014351 [Plasmopara halstedii]
MRSLTTMQKLQSSRIARCTLTLCWIPAQSCCGLYTTLNVRAVCPSSNHIYRCNDKRIHLICPYHIKSTIIFVACLHVELLVI